MKRKLGLALVAALLTLLLSSTALADFYHSYEWGLFRLNSEDPDVLIDTSYPIDYSMGCITSGSWRGSYASYVVEAPFDELKIVTSGDYQYYPLDDGTVALLYIDKGHQTKKMILPDSIDGKPVSRLGYDMNLCTRHQDPNDQYIYRNMFSNVVEEVVLPEGLVCLSADVFVGSCIRKLTLNDSIKQIGSIGKGGITIQNIPKSLETLGTLAFSDVSFKNSKLSLGENVKQIGDVAFVASSITSVKLPNSIEKIGKYAFARCTSLKTVTLEDGVPYISEGMFSECQKLAKITLPASITSIGTQAFNDCEKLSSVTIKSTVLTTIDAGAFQHCSNLSKITQPEGVLTIGDDAFFDCAKLSAVTLPQSLTSIGSHAFDGCSPKLKLTVVEDSYAQKWAGENHIEVKVIKNKTAQ